MQVKNIKPASPTIDDIYQDIKTLPQMTQHVLLRELTHARVKEQISALSPDKKELLAAKLAQDRMVKKSRGPTTPASHKIKERDQDGESGEPEEGSEEEDEDEDEEEDAAAEIEAAEAAAAEAVAAAAALREKKRARKEDAPADTICSLCGRKGHTKTSCIMKKLGQPKKKVSSA